MPIFDQATVSKDRRLLLIRQALDIRRTEVREEGKRRLSDSASFAVLRIANILGKPRASMVLPEPGDWWESTLELEDFLLTAASDGSFTLLQGQPAKIAAPTHIGKKTAANALETLEMRYRCPLNIVRPAESPIFEEALRYLMVVDRAERVDGLCDQLRWILLNLVALRCRVAPDIRGLDVLNVFWERQLKPWPQTMLAWSLLGSYDAALGSFA
jgi:hypothetical protein